MRALLVGVALASACCGSPSAKPPPAPLAYPTLPPEIRKLALALDDAIADSPCRELQGDKSFLPIEPGAGAGPPSCGPRVPLEQLRWDLLRTFGGCAACMVGCPGCDAVCSGAELASTLIDVDRRLALYPDVRRKLDAIWRLPQPFPVVPADQRCPRDLGPGLQPGAPCQVPDRRHVAAPEVEACALLAACVTADLSLPATTAPGTCREHCDQRFPEAPCGPGLRCVRWQNFDRSADVCVP